MLKPNANNISLRRRLTNGLALGSITAAALVVTIPLFLILGTVIYHGIGGLNWDFFTQIPKPMDETGGGMANAIVGSIMILGLASIIGVPLGIGAGVFLAEYGRNTAGNIVRFTADVLNGVPSIVIGLTAYALVVVPQHHFSMLSGSVALGIMMIPTISRTTEEVLLMVPQSIREAALGLGIPQWRTTDISRAADSQRRHCHQHHAGLCPDRRRDGALDVYRSRQPVLEYEAESTDCGFTASDFQLFSDAL